MLKKRGAWLIGPGISTAMWICLFAFADIHFAVNDDQFLLRTFAGASPMGAPTFHLYIHAMYAFPLSWLSRLFPSVAWMSVLEIFLQWLSTAVMVKSIVECFERRCRLRHATALGAFFALCFALLFQLLISARITYTTVAASLGAACVAQCLSVDCERADDGAVVRGMLLSLLLLVLCYGLRQMVALPALAFCGVAFLYRLVTCFGHASGRGARPMWITLAVVAVVMGGLAAAREAEITARGQREYLAWQQARISAMDYMELSDIDQDARRALGWSDAQVELLDNWYTMEETISAERFYQLRQTHWNEAVRTTAGAAVQDFLTRSPLIARAMLVLLGLGLLCLLGLALRRKRLWTFLALLAAALGCALLLAYLALQGRLPNRAVLTPVLPAAALVFCLLPECLPDRGAYTACVCTLLAVGTLVCAVPTAREVRYVPPKWEYDTYAAMDEVALAHPDLLLIYSNELVNDVRLFPDFSSGVPTNLMFWGGWQRGSPEYRSQMEAFGLDSDHFTPADWLNPSLRYLTLQTEPNPALVEHLRETLGDALAWERTQMDEALYAYRFYLRE